MKLKKGDNVLVVSGKDKGKRGKILQAFPQDFRIVVEGMNMKKKHRKPTKAGEKGQMIQLPAPFASGKVKMVCPSCGKPTRIGYVKKAETKARICKKCGKELL